MILYNVTVNIDQEVEEEWLVWMKEEHIPAVMNTGFFEDNRLYKLLHETEGGGINYSVQYFAKNMQQVQEYHKKHAEALQEEFKKKFGERYVVFRSLLELVK